MEKELLKRLIDTAAGRIPADLLVKNGIVADVYSGCFVERDIAVSGGRIAAIGRRGDYEGLETLDAAGLYALPGFIDSHIHIESSFLSPPELGKLLVPLGTSTIIADPHEIANVAGLAGIGYMLEASENLPLDIKFMLPSCVPSTPFEHAGARLDADALDTLLGNERVFGLGEMMNYPGVTAGDDDALDKIVLALKRGKFVDGHSPGLAGKGLAAYAAAMIHTDHECSTLEEMRERLEKGMYVMLRQGSACKDLRVLARGVHADNSRRCLLCSDDCQPHTILSEGHINNDLRICVEEGIDPMTALRMATLNPAECFGLGDRGGFAPGLRADIVLTDDLARFMPVKVFIKGILVAENGRFLPSTPEHNGKVLRNSFHVKDFSTAKLAMNLKSSVVCVIDIKPGSVLTGKGRAEIKRDAAGNFEFDPEGGIAKIAVVERHKNTGNVGLGLIRGYGIRRGAAAISVAHDSHNIIAAGCSDNDIAVAVERVIAMGGGAALALDGNIIEEMPLPLGGLMSDRDGEWVERKLRALQRAAVASLGISGDVEPLMTLCFMSLPVIPKLKITDMGLFDTETFSFVPIEYDCPVQISG